MGKNKQISSTIISNNLYKYSTLKEKGVESLPIP
jgi:hypothetical protein